MYRGVAAETASTDAAVAATSGQIVTYNGAPAVTYFFASSGGYTENIEDVWPGATPDPWLRGVPDPYDGAGGDPYHHWTRQMSLATAAKDLGKLVKGKLVGIKVTEHGASPRIMTAKVIGTGGTVSVTGSQLEGAFGLLSTWAAFTTISSSASPTPAAAPRVVSDNLARSSRRSSARSGRWTTPSQTLSGNVVPAGKGAHVTLEVRAGKRWRRDRRCAASARGGSYSVRLASAGRVSRRCTEASRGPSVVVR